MKARQSYDMAEQFRKDMGDGFSQLYRTVTEQIDRFAIESNRATHELK